MTVDVLSVVIFFKMEMLRMQSVFVMILHLMHISLFFIILSHLMQLKNICYCIVVGQVSQKIVIAKITTLKKSLL
jgi:hypothetical protein